MKERSVTFNHGYLCEMLRAASDFDLANVIKDVEKEQNRRCKEQCEAYAKNIWKAIEEAIDAGFIVNFYTDGNESAPDYYIHANNLFLTNVSVELDEED